MFLKVSGRIFFGGLLASLFLQALYLVCNLNSKQITENSLLSLSGWFHGVFLPFFKTAFDLDLLRKGHLCTLRCIATGSTCLFLFFGASIRVKTSLN